jgi:hypothetical protein
MSEKANSGNLFKFTLKALNIHLVSSNFYNTYFLKIIEIPMYVCIYLKSDGFTSKSGIYSIICNTFYIYKKLLRIKDLRTIVEKNSTSDIRN